MSDLSRYKKPHIDVLLGYGFEAQGGFGRSPAAWVRTMGFDDVPDQHLLPSRQLTRHEVREICRSNKYHPLFGYVCAMAWGLQGNGVTIRYARNIWFNYRKKLYNRILKVKNNNLNRIEAYETFWGAQKIPGLGPAYFTKILYFFGKGKNFYIMDQWTSKSINLILGKDIVKINGHAVSVSNTPQNYNNYCNEIDALASIVGLSGSETEEMIFSKGGRFPGAWREYVRKNWKNNDACN